MKDIAQVLDKTQRFKFRGEVEVKMDGTSNGTHFVDSVPGNGGIESVPLEPNDNRNPPPCFIRFMRWIEQPMNLALFLWLIPVVIGLLTMLLLMTGALDRATKTRERRKIWTEVDNQILNAFFTLGCLFTHPEVFYHFLFVIRWAPQDQVSVRSVYCKNKTPAPRDRWHLLFVACLINLTWIGQYVMCSLYWGFDRHDRPTEFLTFWEVVTILAPVVAYFYTAKGPLKADKIEEVRFEQPEINLKMYKGGVIVPSPEWNGGLFDFCDDATVCCSVFVFPLYLFGKNTKRLGFGSRNLHIVTLAIAVIAPFVVFYIASLKIHSHAIKITLWVVGALFSWFGLLYGGYWRIRMRERYNLPENPLCFGVPFLTDYFQWLFCAPCSLAQEVRTANAYDIEEAGNGHADEMSAFERIMAPPHPPAM